MMLAMVWRFGFIPAHRLELSLDLLPFSEAVDSRYDVGSPERLGRLGEEMLVAWVSGMDRLDALLLEGVRPMEVFG